jgi:DNA-binding transcriptional regulator YhcF (GntR family)
MTADNSEATTLAARIAWTIATGQLPPGSRLPSLRQASRHWDTSVHTVRAAYHLLAVDGLIEITPQSHARVTADGAERGPVPLDTLVRQLFDTAQRTLRAGPEEVLGAVQAQVDWSGPAVTVLECSTTLAESLAKQVRTRWRVRAKGARIGLDSIPQGQVLSTWFHRKELTELASLGRQLPTFVRIRPASATLERLRGWCEIHTARPVVLLETDPRLAKNVVGDLAGTTGQPPEVIITSPEAARSEVQQVVTRALCLVSPRLWDALAPEDRLRPGVGLLDYDIDRDDLEAIGRDQCWQSAIASSRKPPS